MRKLLNALTVLAAVGTITGCLPQPVSGDSGQSTGCPAAPDLSVSINPSQASAGCAFPFVDTRGNIWLSQTRYYAPTSVSNPLRECRTYSLRDTQQALISTGSTVFVDPATGETSRKLPGICLTSGGPISLPAS